MSERMVEESPAYPLEARHGLLANVRNMPLSSIDATTPAGRVRLYNAVSDSEYSIEECLDSEIEITDYVIYVGEMAGENGQPPREIIRCTLLSADGTRYTAASEGIIQAVSRIIHYVRPAPWSPPLKVIPIQGKSRAGRTFYTLQLAEIDG